MKHSLIKILAVVGFATSASAGSVTDTYSSFWALGDSLTDTGNLPGFAYYFATDGRSGYVEDSNTYLANDKWGFDTGRLTNGRTWAERVATEFASAGRATGNLAVSGAGATDANWLGSFIIDNLDDQTNSLAAKTGSFGDKPLVSLWFGANDIFAKLGKSDLMTTVNAAADAVTNAATTISGWGVTDFLIPNLPDIGKTPAYALIETGLQSAATAASHAFNARLASNIAALELSGLNVVAMDVAQMMDDIFADPGAHGYTDLITPCIFPDNSAASDAGQNRQCSVAEASDRLFFDEVHPNSVAHRHMAETAMAALEANLAAVPVPASLPMAVFAVGAIGWVARRRT